jgi:hypothetical protein
MPSEMSRAERVRQTRITCGRKATLVSMAASEPMTSA